MKMIEVTIKYGEIISNRLVEVDNNECCIDYVCNCNDEYCPYCTDGYSSCIVCGNSGGYPLNSICKGANYDEEKSMKKWKDSLPYFEE